MARNGLYVLAVVQLITAVLFFIPAPFVVALWPLPGTTPLTFIFLSSIFAAAGAPTLWALITNNDGALAGIGLDYITILVPMGIYLLMISGGSQPIIVLALLFFSGVPVGAALLWWGLKNPLPDTPAVPGLVRISFIGFTLTLLVVGVRLVLKVPNLIPWSITPDLSVMIGWMFLGAAAYFTYALLRPGWRNAAGQLIGFLAYDLVLIVPFTQRVIAGAGEFQFGLIAYTTVLVISAALAIYYLFVHKETRLWPVQAAETAQAAEGQG